MKVGATHVLDPNVEAIGWSPASAPGDWPPTACGPAAAIRGARPGAGADS